MPKLNDNSRAEFILQFSCDVLLKMLETTDDPTDATIAVIALSHATNLIDAFEHMQEPTHGTH